MNSKIALPQLQSVKLGDYAFRNTKTIGVSNLVSLQSIEFGVECFNGASSFSLIGMDESIIWRIGLPQLQSVKLNNNAFQNTKSFEMSNLTSLQSIDIGQSCFNGANAFSLIGIVESIIWRIGLPQLQSIKMNNLALIGDNSRKTIDEYPYNYNNTMIMKSRIDWGRERNRSPIAGVIHRKWQQLHVFRFSGFGE